VWTVDFSIDCECGAIVEPTRTATCCETGHPYPVDYPKCSECGADPLEPGPTPEPANYERKQMGIDF
jgi:hypothetical protein